MDRFIYTLFVCLLAGCASLRPASSAVAPDESEPSPVLRVIEGRPRSVLLQVTFAEAEAGDELLLQRFDVTDGAEPVPLVRVPLDGRLLELARSEGVGLQDESAEFGNDYLYEVIVERGDVVTSRSERLMVDWREPPGRPERFEVEQLTAESAEVRWAPSAGAALFVRDVLVEGSRPRRVDVPPQASGRTIVRGLSRGGVYAFRVALAREAGGFSHYGTPSEEVYLTLEETERTTDAPSN